MEQLSLFARNGSGGKTGGDGVRAAARRMRCRGPQRMPRQFLQGANSCHGCWSCQIHESDAAGLRLLRGSSNGLREVAAVNHHAHGTSLGNHVQRWSGTFVLGHVTGSSTKSSEPHPRVPFFWTELRPMQDA